MLFYSIATSEESPTGIKELICPIRTLKAFLLPKESILDLDTTCGDKLGIAILYGKGLADNGYILPAPESVQAALEKALEMADESWSKCLVFIEKSEQDASFTPERVMLLAQNLIQKAGFEDVFQVLQENHKTSKMEKMLAEAFSEEVIAVTQMLGMSFFDDKKDALKIKPIGLMAAMRDSHEDAHQETDEAQLLLKQDVSKKLKEKIKSKSEKPAEIQPESEKPTHFRVNKGSIREFSSWRNLLVEYSKIIIKKKGMTVFKEKVFNCSELAGPVFGNQKPDQLPRTQYYEFSNTLYCWLDKPTKAYEQPVKILQELFPEMALKFIVNGMENEKN